MGRGDHPMLSMDLMGNEGIEQHRAFVNILRESGAEVLFLEKILDEAIDQSRAQGHFREWLSETVPKLADRESEITASVLLGAVDEFVYHVDRHGNFCPLIDPLKWLFYTRDSAVMTPRGVLICNFVNRDRAFEASLIRLAFQWSPTFRDYPIAFDATEQGVYIQGGDVIVADENTLFVGVRNLTDEAVAPMLAKQLNMNVVSVQMPGSNNFNRENAYEGWHALRALFLHLDSIFNFIDIHTVVALPYFLEAEYTGCDPLTKILQGLGQVPGVNASDMEEIRHSLENVGWVKRYRAGSGELDTDVNCIKIVDYLKSQKFDIIYVGGSPSDSSEMSNLKFVLECVLRELRFQAANVVATGPRQIIAYHGNKHTLQALNEANVDVQVFRGHELVRWNGGPHCMTMPLERLPPNQGEVRKTWE
jgi:arginine deiminase